MLNKWIGIGRLGNKPELRITTTGKCVGNFSMAVDGGDKDKTEWIDVVVWGKTAENCDKYLDKGSLVAVEGRAQTRSWEAQDGTKRRKTEIVAMRVVFLDSKGNGNKNNNAATGITESASQIEFNEDDIPF